MILLGWLRDLWTPEWVAGSGFTPEDSHHPRGRNWHWVNGANARHCEACRERLARQVRQGYLP